jgi:hypothetical protein
VALTVLGLLMVAPGNAAEAAHGPRERAEQAYLRAREQSQAVPQDPQAGWELGRACFDWAEFATNDTQRAILAREGIAACERVLEQNDGVAGAHYYLGMNQGQLARTMSLGALKLVQEMEAHFQKARQLDAAFDQGGPDRNLGLLYLEAPGWPVSLGSRSKARTHLRKSVEHAPLFPENRLNLMDAYARWNELNLLQREMKAWDQCVDEARREFAGERWQWDWPRWERRVQTLRQGLSRTASSRHPRGS